MSTFSLLVSFAAIFGAVLAQEKTQIVRTKQGKIEGSLASNGLYYEYLGVKYGVPVKFRAPQEPPNFVYTYKANKRTVTCPQFPSTDPLATPSETEDSLLLNIYTPASPKNITYPVMVYLHGGGFGVGSGSPNVYGPQYLISHDVVVVTVNYRLNVYGFLNLGIKEAPGNAGLKDIRAALRWIKRNIRVFNGDPNNVTVFGQGSGGAAAILLTLSESTKGLFHKIISESGTVFSPQSFDANPLATATQIAKSLNVNTENPNELFELYSKTPTRKVLEAVGKQMNPKSVFLPTVEAVFEGEEPFLCDTPYNILAAGRKHSSFHPVPIIIGLSTVEGLTSTLEYHTITSQMNRIKNEDFSTLDQRNLIVPKEEKEEFRKILKDTYFVDTDSDETVIGGLINFNTDFSYTGPISLFSDLYANSTTVYQYIFEYIGNRNFGRLLTNSSLEATTNMDEMFYIFELEKLPLPMDEDDARMITFMTMMWTNFAKFGTPTPEKENGEWLPHPHHLAINLEPKYVSPLTPDRAHFWRSFYYKYGADIIKK